MAEVEIQHYVKAQDPRGIQPHIVVQRTSAHEKRARHNDHALTHHARKAMKATNRQMNMIFSTRSIVGSIERRTRKKNVTRNSPWKRVPQISLNIPPAVRIIAQQPSMLQDGDMRLRPAILAVTAVFASQVATAQVRHGALPTSWGKWSQDAGRCKNFDDPIIVLSAKTYANSKMNCTIQWVSEIPGARASIHSARMLCSSTTGTASGGPQASATGIPAG